MKQIGTVEEIDGKIATVKIHRTSACGGNCGSCGGCSNVVYAEAENLINAAVGDKVEIEMPTKTIGEAIFAAYVFPVAALIAGFCIGSLFFEEEWKRILCGVFATLVSVCINIIYSKKKSHKYKISIAKIIHS